ncbi:hypothetical protein DACRYDRAFT_19437, partial [Dacryopinax primogenitus]
MGHLGTVRRAEAGHTGLPGSYTPYSSPTLGYKEEMYPIALGNVTCTVWNR